MLRDDRIIETVSTLKRRISDRFPNAGLARLCDHLYVVAQQASDRSQAIGQPIRWIRLTSYAVVASLILFVGGVVVYGIQNAGAIDPDPPSWYDWIGVLESGLNDLIFFALAIFFLMTLENRIKRRRALKAIHELRSIAHVIDMHQLTKDPERFLKDWSSTTNSPKQTMTPFLLNRYLDYCSEMLSLTGKIAAMYVQHFDDADAVAAVGEIEQLTTGLSRKIWQKIMILEQFRDTVAVGDTVPVRD